MYPYGYGYYFDPTYILIIIGVIITMIASSKMNSTFRRYSRVRCHCGLTGSQAADLALEGHTARVAAVCHRISQIGEAATHAGVVLLLLREVGRTLVLV